MAPEDIVLSPGGAVKLYAARRGCPPRGSGGSAQPERQVRPKPEARSPGLDLPRLPLVGGNTARFGDKICSVDLVSAMRLGLVLRREKPHMPERPGPEILGCRK